MPQYYSNQTYTQALKLSCKNENDSDCSKVPAPVQSKHHDSKLHKTLSQIKAGKKVNVQVYRNVFIFT